MGVLGRERHHMKTNVTISVLRGGYLASRQRVSNRVITAGVKATARLLGNCGGVPNLISVGTGTTAVADGDRQLEAEVFRNRVTRAYGGPSTAVYQLSISTAQANGYTLSEAGLWVGVSGDSSTAAAGIVDATAVIFARVLFEPFAKTSADTMILTWEIPITSVRS
jgi:hypothetical protein